MSTGDYIVSNRNLNIMSEAYYFPYMDKKDHPTTGNYRSLVTKFWACSKKISNSKSPLKVEFL